jgi:hypothetical protein
MTKRSWVQTEIRCRLLRTLCFSGYEWDKSIGILCSCCMEKKSHKGDFSNAFQTTELIESKIYISIPEGLEFLNGAIDRQNCCFLWYNAINGLKQSGHKFKRNFMIKSRWLDSKVLPPIHVYTSNLKKVNLCCLGLSVIYLENGSYPNQIVKIAKCCKQLQVTKPASSLCIALKSLKEDKELFEKKDKFSVISSTYLYIQDLV